MTVHACPPTGSGLMPCCGHTPFEASHDRMTSDPTLVTCGQSAGSCTAAAGVSAPNNSGAAPCCDGTLDAYAARCDPEARPDEPSQARTAPDDPAASGDAADNPGPMPVLGRIADAADRVESGVRAAALVAVSGVVKALGATQETFALTGPALDVSPGVQGRCPACRGESLFLGAGGYVTCRRLECPDPEAATNLLEGEPAEPLPDRAQAAIRTLEQQRDAREQQLAEARETNRRLNYRCQNAEHIAAVFKRAVGDWEWNEKGTYVPLRSLTAIAKAVGLKFDSGKLEHHVKRVERLQAQVGQLTALCQTAVTAGAISANDLRAALGMPEAGQ